MPAAARLLPAAIWLTLPEGFHPNRGQSGFTDPAKLRMLGGMEQRQTLHFIDATSRSRAELARIGFGLGHHSEVYGDIAEFCMRPPREGVVVARDDAQSGGIERIFDRLSDHGIWLPLIAIDEEPHTDRIVGAIKAGALDYLPLPLDPKRFADTLERIVDEARVNGESRRRMIDARNRMSNLSNREREVLDWLAEGSSNKAIARELEISPRTVEIHRANMMNKLGAKHSAEAVRLRIEAQIS